MAPDDNESRLPERVERALAEARQSASSRRTGKPGQGGRWLAFVPVGIAFVMLALMMPRATRAEDIPLPRIDRRALSATTKDDMARAERVRAPDQRMRDDVLAVGSAIRAYQKAQASAEPPDVQSDLKLRLENALNLLLTRDQDTTEAYENLKSLRAVQLDQFLAAVAHYEATGTANADLQELGGSFVERMTSAGWMDGTKLVLDDAQRRAAFKTVWTAVVVGNAATPLAISLDEQRVLYGLYLTRPHPAENLRRGFDARKSAAATPAECLRVQHDEAVAAESWRADKIRRLGELDPTYPATYALGVAYFRAGHYEDSAQAFQTWLDTHPDGAWTLRARNHLKAALIAQGP